MPSHLSRSHRDLIYKEKHQRTLEIEPVFATISGENFQLEHIDRLSDVPGKKSGLKKAVELMKEKGDWDNLPSLLIGFKDAKRVISGDDLCWLVRKAGIAGRPDIILECARRVSDTGFTLRSPMVVAELMWQLQHRAVKSGWALKETKQALSWAEMVSELLEDVRHAGGRLDDLQNDVRVQPEVIGVLLQLSAAQATRFADGDDRDGKVAQYTARLLGSPARSLLDPGIWHNMPKPTTQRRATDGVQPAAVNPDTEQINLSTSLSYVNYVVPVLHGLKLAAPILGPVEGLEKMIAEIEYSVSAEREILLKSGHTKNKEDQPFRGLMIYDQLLGPDSKLVVSMAERSKAPAALETATELAK